MLPGVLASMLLRSTMPIFARASAPLRAFFLSSRRAAVRVPRGISSEAEVPEVAASRKVVVVKKKWNKAAAIQRHLEDKLLFGDLLKTSAERKKDRARKTSSRSKNSVDEITSDVEKMPYQAVKKRRGRPKKETSGEHEPVREGRLFAHLQTCRASVSCGVVPAAWDAVSVPMKFNPTDVPVIPGERALTDIFPEETRIKLPSVTRILSETMPPESRAALEAWKERMIGELGLEGFRTMQKETLERGKLLHKYLLARISRQPVDEPEPRILNFVKSVRSVLGNVKDADVERSEKPVVHPFLGYWGIPDCIASFRGKPVIIDWKTSQRPRRTMENLYDGPVQIAAYLGAMNAMHPDRQMESGVVIVVYESGAPADVHVLSETVCEKFWVKWLQRLKAYQLLAANKREAEIHVHE